MPVTEATFEFQSGDPAFMTDQAQRIVHINDAACKMLDIDDARSVLGQHCYQVVRGRKMNGAPLCEASCTVAQQVRSGGAPDTFSMLLPVGPPRANAEATALSDRLPVEVSCVVVHQQNNHGGTLLLHLLRDVQQVQAALRFATSVVEQAGRFLSDATTESPVHTLTNQERRVLTLIARGMDTAAAAEALSLSKSTVRNHTQHILKKLGCHSRLEAVALARPVLLANSFDAAAD
jgi:DNA-binding CsgD family transcriptional regulator